MVRRPRPPPVTGKRPRPLTPKRCTETSAKSPAPYSLKLPPPYLAKLWQLNDQTTRQRPGAANRPLPDPALPRRCHSTPGSRWALVEVGTIAAGSGPFGRSCPACRRIPAFVAGAPGRWAAARGHRATSAATTTAATTRFAARNTTPNRRYHGALGEADSRQPSSAPLTADCTRLPSLGVRVSGLSSSLTVGCRERTLRACAAPVTHFTRRGSPCENSCRSSQLLLFCSLPGLRTQATRCRSARRTSAP